MNRKATKKNIEEFMLMNPDVKEIIDNVIKVYFLTNDLIIDGEIPYDNIIKELVRNYETVTEGDVLKYLLDKTENKNKLYRIKIANKTEYYISKLKDVCQEIYLDLCKSETTEIKLSDKIEINQDLATAIGVFVTNKIIDWTKNYESIPPYSKVLDDDGQTILLGKFFKRFIFWDFGNIQFKKKYYSDEHFKPFNEMDFHCYGCNNNTDVLFTKQEHDFSFSTMKYDFEEGYIPDENQCQQEQQVINQYNYKKKSNGCLGVVGFFVIILSAICLII